MLASIKICSYHNLGLSIRSVDNIQSESRFRLNIPFTMHELSITERILEIALKHGKRSGATRITELFLVIGELSSVVDDSVQFYWDLISQDTIAYGARLHFRRIPTEFRCQECGKEYAPAEDQFACPACASRHVRVLAGEEFFLEAIDIET